MVIQQPDGSISPLGNAAAGSSGNAKGSTQDPQADKVDPLIADIDLSDVPESIRSEVQKALLGKVKSYDRDYRHKTELLSTEKKELESRIKSVRDLEIIRDELSQSPELKDAVDQLYRDFKSGKMGKTQESVDKNVAKIDSLIERTSDPEVRENLRETRDIMVDLIDRKAAGLSTMEKRLALLEQELKSTKNAVLTSQEERAEANIAKLQDRFGKDIVEKYSNDLKAAFLKYPGVDILKVLKLTVSDEDLRSAYRAEDKLKEERERDKKRRGSDASSGSGMAGKGYDLKRDPKTGRVDTHDLINKIKERHNL